MNAKPIRVFISSRVYSKLYNKFGEDYTLSNLRVKIKETLEAEELLGEKIIQVVINEDSFNGNFSKDWYQQCLLELRQSHACVILYSEDSGWFQPGTDDNGICHEEFIIAFSQMSQTTFGFNLSNLVEPIKATKEKKERNTRFEKEIKSNGVFLESINADSAEELEVKIITQIKKKLLHSIATSIDLLKSHSRSSNTFESTLDWSKLSYNQRINEMEKQLMDSHQKDELFKDVIISYHAIPDHMSVADARNRINRPFLEEYDLLDKYKGYDKGIIHMIAVYGSATEIQAKNLVGYPDLTVIKGPFGFYLWDKIRHIQIFFLSRCINPETIRSRIMEVRNWIKASKELNNIHDRAEGRYKINQTIKEMQKYAD